MLRLAGAGLVVFSAGLWGWRKAWQEETRLEQLAGWEQAITLLKAEIGFALRPLSEACGAIARRLNGIVGVFWEEAGNELASLDHAEAAHAWEAALTRCRPAMALLPADVEAVADFGRTLGYLDAQAQLAACDLLLDYLARARQEGLERQQKNGKLYKSLGLLSGLLLAVALL